MVERCVCCGAVVPEGRQVCPICEADTDRPAEKPLQKRKVKKIEAGSQRHDSGRVQLPRDTV